ncbi:MAG: hypothetical protein OXE94_04025 [Aestuariivita sp.]|nr:hypothetical protein [Aestuariivita sp.]MCY4201687.1 hypothetical protein [Aestuariivita sp.]
MNTLDPETLHRTTKLELDEGRAQSLEEAQEIMKRYVLQIDAGIGVLESETRQAMLLTAVNTAARAFLGGVRVRICERGRMGLSWAHEMDMVEAIKVYGGEIVETLSSEYPTLVIGEVSQPTGSLVVFGTWEGWSGGVVEKAKDRLCETVEFPLAGMLAASLGVSEAFQNLRGNVFASRRSAGLSLWEPRRDWREKSAFGEPCLYLPKRLWLIGLGHLGQAYAWALGLLPYEDTSDVDLMLQDFDHIVKANESTGMLINETLVGQKKTRAVSKRLEALGFNTSITERQFDLNTRRNDNEPGVALVGVDAPTPRRQLEGAGFDLIVDAGLGGGQSNYLEILVHSFPSGIKAVDAFPVSNRQRGNSLVDLPAYKDHHQKMREATDLTDAEIDCGIIEVAGRSIGAAFVGSFAATFVISEVLRNLAGIPECAVFSVSLQNPDKSQASIKRPEEGRAINSGFVKARISTHRANS